MRFHWIGDQRGSIGDIHPASELIQTRTDRGDRRGLEQLAGVKPISLEEILERLVQGQTPVTFSFFGQGFKPRTLLHRRIPRPTQELSRQLPELWGRTKVSCNRQGMAGFQQWPGENIARANGCRR